MSKKTRTETSPSPQTEPVITPDPVTAAHTPSLKRFDCFLIDTGWNEPVSKAVQSHLPTYFGDHNPDPLYILSPRQSVAIVKLSPELIGHDPTILVYDLHVPPTNQGKRNKYRGFRLNLGLMKHPQQAVARLQDFIRFLIVHRNSKCLECEVQRELHREGFHGMIKILRETKNELL